MRVAQLRFESAADETATAMKNLFDSLVARGFSEKAALELVSSAFKGVVND